MNISKVNFTIAKLSKEIGLSRAQLYRKLNSMSNTSPVQFLRDVSLRYALNLIKERELTISEIAYELGFSNPSYFAKCFKEKYGISPFQNKSRSVVSAINNEVSVTSSHALSLA